nr:Uncharacterised protein [Raoultella sp. NCTC 9187]
MNLTTVRQAANQAVTGHLHALDHRHQNQYRAHHYLVIKALVAVADRQVAQSAAADHPGHRRKSQSA